MELVSQPKGADLSIGLQHVMLSRGEVSRIEWVKRARIVENIQAFRPCLTIVRVYGEYEWIRRSGVGVRVQGKAPSYHAHAP